MTKLRGTLCGFVAFLPHNGSISAFSMRFQFLLLNLVAVFMPFVLLLISYAMLETPPHHVQKTSNGEYMVP